MMFFLYGCITFKDYGLSMDETVQRRHSLVNYKYLVPSVEQFSTESVDFSRIPDLVNYGLYGVAIQLPMVALEHLFRFELSQQQIFLMRHFLTFFVFFVSTIFFYKTVELISDRKWIALLGTVFLFAPLVFWRILFIILKIQWHYLYLQFHYFML